MSKNEAKRIIMATLSVADALCIEALGLDFWAWLDSAAALLLECQAAKKEG